MMLTQRLWMIPVAQWVGLIGAALALFGLAHGVPPAWALLWLAGQMAGSIAVSVGLHRYFTHGAFTTNRFWHLVLAVYATLTVQGSPLGWAAAHMTHHRHSDGPGDPHYTGLSYLWLKQYNNVPMVMRRVRRLVKDPVLAFTHRYAALIIFAWGMALLWVGELTGTAALPLVFGYLAPLGTTHLAGAVHQVTSHRCGNGARDMPWMEWILPASGEWMHKHHHDHPKDPRMGQKWWHLDFGWLFIKSIRTNT